MITDNAQQQQYFLSQMSGSNLHDRQFALSYMNDRSHKRRSTAINRFGKRNLAKLACRTDSPSCLRERKKVVKFSESFDVDLHYTLMRPLISLVCRVSIKRIIYISFLFV